MKHLCISIIIAFILYIFWGIPQINTWIKKELDMTVIETIAAWTALGVLIVLFILPFYLAYWAIWFLSV